ncbi:flagellar basal-body rod protein FlgC [Gemmatirosa kalamazoonensis]|uniref:Flagellar basal-body rod protein FlgC n=1 Tax=Gemmatirosa kalamazoonensis TaxID=861299 RepID=W0R9F6_9BACT|nr:flagellar basal body rod protein FlgC [Gemmatirosa kalamazoonensis]AHG87719.1 flagellar basal-body rod protein FlgC [Gemmatirosa kalamazoonensis]
MPDFPSSRPIGLLPAILPQSPVRPMFRSLALAASGLSAQRQRIETIASNLANAETTRTDGGGPYKRKVTVLQAASADTDRFGVPQTAATLGTTAPPNVPPFGVPAFQVPGLSVGGLGGDDPRNITVPALPSDDGQHGVRVAQIAEDASEGPLVYDPGHPDADANGYVRYPNVRVSDEMVDLLDAKRIYEANATVFQSAKAMLKSAISI